MNIRKTAALSSILKRGAGLALLAASVLPLSAANIMPAIGGAEQTVSWTNGYFRIKGKPVILTGGEIHYARIPRELWRDRLWRIKQMGFNTVQFYTFWNSNEPKDGVWDFTGNSDLTAFLSLVQEMGLYAIARVGPYCCAEWEHGGFPAWLTSKPGMVLRDDDEQFLRYADRYLAKVYEILAKQQIHKGGPVIMMQLENEHVSVGASSRRYLAHLYDQARAGGMEIPLFFSGLRHGGEPSGEAPYSVGQSPWYTTEFWTGWIGKYGDMVPEMLHEKVRGTWKIIAFGGGGYGYYMVHGGSNFGYSGDSPVASYDYSAAIGEWGRLQNLYFPARRAALFAQSFSSLLTGSQNAPDFAAATAKAGRVTTRTSPRGSIVFADNFLIPADKHRGSQQIEPTEEALVLERSQRGKLPITTRLEIAGHGVLPSGGDLVLHPNDLRTLIVDLPWTPGASFAAIAANVLLRQTIAGVDTWVCYGAPGDYGEVNVKRSASSNLPSRYSFNFPKDDAVQEIQIDSGDGRKAFFLVMNAALADRTWALTDKLVVGATFVHEDGAAELPPEGGAVRIYPGAKVRKAGPVAVATVPTLGNWRWRDAARERLPEFDDGAWLRSAEAQPMETYDDFQNRYGWYRATLKGARLLQLRPAGFEGEFRVFLNGERADLKQLILRPGENTLALLAKAGARTKLYAFSGVIDRGGARGIWGPFLKGTEPVGKVTNWKMTKVVDKEEKIQAERFKQADADVSAWIGIVTARPPAPGRYDRFWLRGTFENSTGLQEGVIFLPDHFNKVGPITERQEFYLNGEMIPVFRERFTYGMFIAKGLKPGLNTVLLKVKYRYKWPMQGAVHSSFELWPHAAEPIGWKFRGGLEGLDETAIIGLVKNWEAFLAKPWNKEEPPPKDMPLFWRTSFVHTPNDTEAIGLQTTTNALTSGQVWLNGHNLGESPQKVPIYMPECWLKKGTNDLVILALEGTEPNEVSLHRYAAWQKLSLRNER